MYENAAAGRLLGLKRIETPDTRLNVGGRVLQSLGCVEGGNLAEEGGAHLGGELLLAPTSVPTSSLMYR